MDIGGHHGQTWRKMEWGGDFGKKSGGKVIREGQYLRDALQELVALVENVSIVQKGAMFVATIQEK